MKKSTLIMALALIMSLALGVGGTLAYLTDRDAETNIFTLGNVDIDLTEDFEQGADLLPGQDVNKVPTIKNEGTTDAWVWMTVAIPAGLEDASDDASKNALHWNWMGSTVDTDDFDLSFGKMGTHKANGWLDADATEDQIKGGDYWVFSKKAGDKASNVEIDGEKFNVYTFKYQSPLKPGEETLAGPLVKVYLDTHVDVDPEGNMYWVDNGNVTDLKWNINTSGNPKIHVAAYATQAEGFATVDDAYKAYGKQWGSNNNAVYGDTTTVSVGNDDDLETALNADAETIIVNLTEDVTYDVAAWAQKGVGGESTKTIVINGNGNTLTFNQTNSDWNNVVTDNGATLVLNDVNITNAGYNDGPWNRHDINFGCDVNMYNVTSDKALAFKAGATLENVTISDANTSDTYAIWIQPNGQTVTLKGCTIDMKDCSDGRGIKIDEQYITNPQKVTLKVTDTTFKTDEKAAIIVKSAAGADITLKNVDITEVAADSTYHVWVDEASKAYYELVVVNGGSKTQE